MSCCITAALPTPLPFPAGVAECTPPTQTDYSLEAGLVTYLTGNDAVFCKVADRVFPYYVPRDVEQAEYPCLVYKISQQPVESITGQSGAIKASVDLECWAPSFDTACKTAEAVRKAMQGFRGWFGNVAVAGSWLENIDDDDEPPQDNSSTYWFARTLSFNVTYLVEIHAF